MAAKDSGKLVIAKTSFYVGEQVGTIKRGDIFSADHDLVKKYPAAFMPAEDRMRTR